MKKLLLGLCLCLSVFSAKAALIDNQSSCDICVVIICYEDPCPGSTGCCIVSETRYFVPANSTLDVPDCGDCTVYGIVQSNPDDCESDQPLGSLTHVADPNFGNCGAGVIVVV